MLELLKGLFLKVRGPCLKDPLVVEPTRRWYDQPGGRTPTFGLHTNINLYAELEQGVLASVAAEVNKALLDIVITMLQLARDPGVAYETSLYCVVHGDVYALKRRTGYLRAIRLQQEPFASGKSARVECLVHLAPPFGRRMGDNARGA